MPATPRRRPRRRERSRLGTENPLARNVLAHVFLDTVAWAERFADPFGAPPAEVEFGTLARLRASDAAAVRGADRPRHLDRRWRRASSTRGRSAGRRSREPAFTAIQGLGTARRERLGRAAFAQFQDHLAALPE